MIRPLVIDIITIFPGMLQGFFSESILKRASEKGAVRVNTINLRDFTDDPHRTTDDRPYGGGPGMLMKPEPFFRAVDSVATDESIVILMSPQGHRFSQRDSEELSRKRHLVFLCGHYEGFDERVRQELADLELSIGDYVLTNGVLAAAVVIDSVVRLLPGVLGCDGSAKSESFSCGMLEYPQYTRPENFRGINVPDILLSGNHGEIERWRREQSIRRTEQRRQDLLN